MTERFPKYIKIIVTITLVFLIMKKIGIDQLVKSFISANIFEVAIALILSPLVIILGYVLTSSPP